MFSITFAASATLMLLRGTRPASTIELVELGDLLQRLRRVARDHLQDLGERVLLVARVDALGRVADEEVLLPAHARVRSSIGDADLFGGAGVDGRFVDDGGAALHVPADAALAPISGPEVGLVRVVDRRRHGDDDEVGLAEQGLRSVV